MLVPSWPEMVWRVKEAQIVKRETCRSTRGEVELDSETLFAVSINDFESSYSISDIPSKLKSRSIVQCP